MAESFELVEIDDLREGLHITIEQGPSTTGPDSEATTDVYIRPPLSPTEGLELLSTELDEDTRQSFHASLETDTWTKFTLDGLPSEAHKTRGIELAKALVSIRGLKGAVVTTVMARKTRSLAVLARSEDLAA